MGTTGLIFAAIAIAWLAYLVPHFVRRKDTDPIEGEDPADRFSESMRIVQRGTAPLLDQDLAEIGFEVSTPLTRRAAINDLRRLELLAARRRRRVLIVLFVLLSAAIGVSAVGLVPWWSVAIPGGLVVAFLVVARFSVVAMRRALDVRFERIARGGVETTVFLRAVIAPETAPTVEQPTFEPVAAPADAGRLWDPIPVTKATYVSKPLAPRTVRTIDLSGPAPSAKPVTADGPATLPAAAAAPDEGEGREAASA